MTRITESEPASMGLSSEKKGRKRSWHSNFKRAPKEQRTSRDGITHDSKAECRRWEHLLNLQAHGFIHSLQRQVRYPLEFEAGGRKITIMAGKRVAHYTPDFVYFVREKMHGSAVDTEIIEDCKGYTDEKSKFRIRVFEALYAKKVAIVKINGNRWVTE